MASNLEDESLLSTAIPLEEVGDDTEGSCFTSSIRQTRYNFTVKDHYYRGPPSPPTGWSLMRYFANILGGRFSHEPEDMVNPESCPLTETTQRLLKERVFHDMDPQDIVDYHCHLVGRGDSGSGCYMHPSLESWWNPFRCFKSYVFLTAAQVTDIDGTTGDMQYISRIIRLISNFVHPSCINQSSSLTNGRHHGKYCMLPFDMYIDPTTKNEELNRTTFYVPNEYSLQLARELPEMFCPVGSVNPYRRDAIDTLQHLNENGVTIIKWLPNSMGIDPSDERCVPFYNKMNELNMILLVHCGEEHTVTAGYIDNALGNPLLLRRPLDCGVKVITAHCASEGYAIDIDNDGRRVPCFDLWLRLMREDKYKKLLFGDISAVCAFLRVSYLHQLIQATDIHDRLVYGSDYPVPAINMVVHTSRLQRFDLITGDEKAALDELYSYNPLLFDFASKRLIRGPNDETFPTQVFKAHPELPPFKNII